MADEILSPLQRVQAMFGVRNDGASYQTKRALQAEGEGAPATSIVPPVVPALTPAYGPTQGVGGPSPSPELLDRVRKQQEQRGADSLRKIMEQRARQYPTPAPDVPPSGGFDGVRG